MPRSVTAQMGTYVSDLDAQVVERRRAQQAAEALRPTAQDLKALGVVDGIIDEPRGGAHKDHYAMAQALGDAVAGSLDELSKLSGDELIAQRVARFRQLGRTA